MRFIFWIYFLDLERERRLPAPAFSAGFSLDFKAVSLARMAARHSLLPLGSL